MSDVASAIDESLRVLTALNVILVKKKTLKYLRLTMNSYCDALF
jgi:hypothetical protein